MSSPIHNSLTQPSVPVAPSSTSNTIRESTSFSHSETIQRKTNISITTDEGDIVTISRSYTQSQAMTSGMSRTALKNSQSFTAASLETESLNIAVKGSLNDEEMTDIQNLLDELVDIAGTFFQGNMEEAVADAMNIGDMGSLSNLSASFSQSMAMSTRLVEHHPIITADLTSDADFEEFHKLLSRERSDELKYSDMLRAQWEEIKKLIDDAITSREPRQGDKKTHSHTTQETAEKMLRNTQATVAKHPRLSPFILPMANRTIDALTAHEPYPEEASRKGDALQAAFFKGFNSWLHQV